MKQTNGTQLNSWTLENFARVDFRTEEFDKMIWQKGTRMVWQRSILCSCLDESTGQPDYTCVACKGKGYSYFDPKEIRAVVSGMDGSKDKTPIGLLEVGTTYLTSRVQDDIGFRDRLTFLDFRTPYSQIIAYDSFFTEGMELKYECEKVVSVQVLGSVITPDNYSISENKQHIKFVDGLFTDGEKFSILYSIKPAYIVIDIPHELRGSPVWFQKSQEEFVLLPKQFMIKREDLLPLQRGQVL